MMDRRLVIPEATLGTIEAVLIGVGITIVLSTDLDNWDVLIAKGCFVFAFFLLCVQIILFLARRRGFTMYLIAFLVCGIFGVVGLGAVNYVSHRRERKSLQESGKNQDSETKPVAGGLAPTFSPAPVSSPSSPFVKPPARLAEIKVAPNEVPQHKVSRINKSRRDETEDILLNRKKRPEQSKQRDETEDILLGRKKPK